MEEKHLEWEGNPRETEKKNLKDCLAFSESRKCRPSLGARHGATTPIDMGGLKLNPCSRILGNYGVFL